MNSINILELGLPSQRNRKHTTIFRSKTRGGGNSISLFQFVTEVAELQNKTKKIDIDYKFDHVSREAMSSLFVEQDRVPPSP